MASLECLLECPACGSRRVRFTTRLTGREFFHCAECETLFRVHGPVTHFIPVAAKSSSPLPEPMPERLARFEYCLKQAQPVIEECVTLEICPDGSPLLPHAPLELGMRLLVTPRPNMARGPQHCFQLVSQTARLPLADKSVDFVLLSGGWRFTRQVTRDLKEVLRVAHHRGAIFVDDVVTQHNLGKHDRRDYLEALRLKLMRVGFRHVILINHGRISNQRRPSVLTSIRELLRKKSEQTHSTQHSLMLYP